LCTYLNIRKSNTLRAYSKGNLSRVAILVISLTYECQTSCTITFPKNLHHFFKLFMDGVDHFQTFMDVVDHFQSPVDERDDLYSLHRVDPFVVRHGRCGLFLVIHTFIEITFNCLEKHQLRRSFSFSQCPWITSIVDT
jgi:hypothetical protein